MRETIVRYEPEPAEPELTCYVCGKPGILGPFCDEHRPPELDEMLKKQEEELNQRMEEFRQEAEERLQAIRSGTIRETTPTFAQIVAVSVVPLYGPVGSPFGLTLSSTQGTEQTDKGQVLRISALAFHSRSPVDVDPTRTEEHLVEARTRLMQQRWEEDQKGKKKSHFMVTLHASSGDTRKIQHPPVPIRGVAVGSKYAAFEDVHPQEVIIYKHELDIMDFRGRLLEGLPRKVREELTEWWSRELCEEASKVIWGFLPDLISELESSEAQTVFRQFVIDGEEFTGKILYWPHAHPLCGFHLERPVGEGKLHVLSGHAFGLELADLIPLLEGMLVINERLDLITQYEAELWQQWEVFQSYCFPDN
jgi:hypothetical protein